MRIRVTAATAALLLTALTACGSSDEETDTKSGTTAPASAQPAESQAPTTLAFGKPADTIGDGGTGELQVTPDTVVFAKEATGETPENDTFAVVTMKDKATSGVAADEPAPISGGGWSWIAPDGEEIAPDGGNSSNIVIDKYNNADPVQPGTFQWRLKAFDLTEAQAKGGTLMYTDGDGTAYRWKMPPTDTGPGVAEVKKGLEF